VDKRFRSTVVEYAVVLVLCIVVLEWSMKLHEARWNIPFDYSGGDAFASIQVIKSVVDTGGYLTNPYLGAPGVFEYYDFPRTEHLQIWLSAFLGWAFGDYAAGVNLYSCLTFPLTALIAMSVFRYLKVSFLPSLVCSLLYAFLPFHFIRLQSHFFLASYFLVPWEILMMLWICRNEQFLRRSKKGWIVPTNKGWACAGICILTASAGTYYTFFACVLLIVAGVYSSQHFRNWKPVRAAFALAGLLVVSSILNLLPFILYWQREGKNPEVATRSFVEADIFGLRLAGLLLPAGGHRIPFVAQKMRDYPVTVINENRAAYLGIVGVCGFLFLLWRLFFTRWLNPESAGEKSELLSSVAVLNGSSVMLAAAGGFGAVFSFLAYSQIRAYNRISIFIAFFALLAVAVYLDRLFTGRRGTSKIQVSIIAAIILIAGLLDQTLPGYHALKQNQVDEFQSDAAFIQQIENAIPEGSMIFQMPYYPFPEVEAPYRMVDYDHFRGYLQSKKLRWSYGAMKGRKTDDWQRETASLSLPDLVKALKQAGFRGIYFDRKGYPRSGGHELELRRLIGRPLFISKNRRLLYFDFPDLTKASLLPSQQRLEKGF
jgi:phosphoglycerol transferase